MPSIFGVAIGHGNGQTPTDIDDERDLRDFGAFDRQSNFGRADEVAEFGIEGLDEARAAELILAARAEEIARLEREG